MNEQLFPYTHFLEFRPDVKSDYLGIIVIHFFSRNKANDSTGIFINKDVFQLIDDIVSHHIFKSRDIDILQVIVISNIIKGVLPRLEYRFRNAIRIVFKSASYHNFSSTYKRQHGTNPPPKRT